VRLLRLLNSASFSLRKRVTSVHEAVTMLGARTVRQWAMLLSLGGITTNCDELIPTALSRARTLSRLAEGRGGDADVGFSIGLLSVADALLEPTVIYVRAVLELLRSDVDVRGLAHITGGGLNNILRLGAGYAIEDPLPVPAVFDLVARLGTVPVAEMWEVFNMGCGFMAIVPEADADAASAILAAHHPGARRIGTVTDQDGTVTVPPLGLSFPLR